jgi:hypothetical protein
LESEDGWLSGAVYGQEPSEGGGVVFTGGLAAGEEVACIGQPACLMGVSVRLWMLLDRGRDEVRTGGDAFGLGRG